MQDLDRQLLYHLSHKEAIGMNISSILKLATGQIKSGIIAIIVFAVVVFVVWSWRNHVSLQRYKSDNIILKQNNAVLTSNAEVLKRNYLVCQTANETSANTIQQLELERNDAKAAIAALAVQQKRDARVIGNLKQQMNQMSNDPANNGPVAPVLRETIRGIQAGESKI